MINEHPVDTFGEVVYFGNPWHGPVQNDTLTLPAGGSIATKVWLQPAKPVVRNQTGVVCDNSGTTAVGVVAQAPMREFDVPGFTHALRALDAPAVPPPDADLAKQWRDKSLLSGAKQQFYGKDIEGWIASPSPGVRKKITLSIPPGPVDMTVALTLTGTRDNFGVGVASAPESLSATLTDWKQYGTGQPLLTRGIDNPVYPNTNGNCNKSTGVGVAPDVTNPTYKKCVLTLYAVSPTGDRALIEISPATSAPTSQFSSPAYVIDPMVRRPIGWLLITIGVSGMTVEAILSRAQTLGTAAEDASFNIVWSGYVIMGFFAANGNLEWFSWSGFSAYAVGATAWTRVTRLDNTLTATADKIEISVVVTNNGFGPLNVDALVNVGDSHVTFYAGAGEDIWPVRIGNGSVTFMRGPSNSAIVANGTVTYSNHNQAITPLGPTALPVQSVAFGPFSDSNTALIPLYSSYCHASGKISALWQTSPICWV